MAVSLAACGNADQSTGGAQGSTTQESAAQSDAAPGQCDFRQYGEDQNYRSHHGNRSQPFIFQGDDGNLDGYDIAVIKEIFSRLPQYELEFQTTEFASIFTGIDAGYYQMGVNNISYNKERGEKYLFSDVYSVSTYGILVRDDNTDIQTLVICRDIPQRPPPPAIMLPCISPTMKHIPMHRSKYLILKIPIIHR